jgi:hypothetical protein
LPEVNLPPHNNFQENINDLIISLSGNTRGMPTGIFELSKKK